MICEEIKHLLSLYLDEQLDEADKNHVEEHLKSCADCIEYYNQLLKLQKMADDFEPGGDQEYWLKLKDTIIEKIEKAEVSGVTPLPAKKSRAMTYRVFAVAATITLVAIISIFELKYDDPEKLPFSNKSQPAVQKFSAPGEPQLKDVDAIKKSEANQRRDNAIQVESLGAGWTDERGAAKTIAVPKPAIPEAELVSELDVKAVQLEPASLSESEPADLGLTTIIEKEDGTEPPPRGKAEKAEPVTMKPEEAVSLSETEEPIKPKKADKKSEADRIAKSDEAGADALYDQAMTAQSLDKSVAVSSEKERVDVYSLSDLGKMNKEQMPEKMLDEEATAENEEYIKWRGKVDSLEAQYGYLLSVHSEEIEAKSRYATASKFNQLDAPPTPPFSEMANAFYTLALITPFDDERKAMLKKLERLAEVADSSSVPEIEKFIIKLESESK